MKEKLLKLIALFFGLTIEIKKQKKNKKNEIKKGVGRPVQENSKRLLKPVRWHDQDYEMVKNASKKMDVHVSEFIRTSAIEKARRIINDNNS